MNEVKEVDQWFYPLIREARHQYPRQYPAYENLKLFLRCQCHLIRCIHEATAHAQLVPQSR